MTSLSRVLVSGRLGEGIEEFFFKQSPFRIWGHAIIFGMLLLFVSDFVEIGDIPLTRDGIDKQVGVWSAPNWSIVYLIIFPLFLVCISRQASFVRQFLITSAQQGTIIVNDGSRISTSELISLLKSEFRAANAPFIFLIIAVLLVAVGGWFLACGAPLLQWKIGGYIISWGTALITYGDQKRAYQIPLLLYSFLAYSWMGLTLFTYLSCLFMGFIYSSFLHKLGWPSGVGRN